MIRFRWIAVTAIAVVASPVVAASCGDLRDSAERLACYDHLAECITTHDAGERLACYDAAASAASAETPEPGDEEPASPARVPATAEAPRAPAAPATPTPQHEGPFAVPGAKPRESEPERLAATIVEVNQGPRGLNYLTLDNGQVWRELSRSRVDFEPGAEVELTPGILGSVNLRIEGRDGYVKVRRVE